MGPGATCLYCPIQLPMPGIICRRRARVWTHKRNAELHDHMHVLDRCSIKGQCVGLPFVGWTILAIRCL